MYKISKFTKLTLLLVSSITLMANIALITTLPHLKEYFNNPNMDLYSRLMLTMPSLTIAILSPIMSKFINWFGKKKSCTLGLIIFGIFGSAGLYLSSIETLLLSRFLLGSGIAILMILSTTLAGDYFQGEDRYKFIGLQNIFIGVGGVTFVFGGGILTDIYWRLPFGIYLIGIVLVPFVLAFIFEVKNDGHEVNEENLNNSLYIIFFLALTYVCMYFVLPTQMPFLMVEKYNASSKVVGAIISSAFLASAVGAGIYNNLKKRFSFLQIYFLSIVVTAFGLALVGFGTSVYFFFITSIISGLGGGAGMTNLSAWMLANTRISQRVKSSAYLTSSIFLGQFLTPVVFGPLIKHLEVQEFFKIIGSCVFLIGCIGLIIIYFYNKKQKTIY